MIAASFDNTVTLWEYNSVTYRFEKRPFLRIKEPDGLWAVGLRIINKLSLLVIKMV